MGKLLEKIFDTRIDPHLESCNGLTDIRYGFRKDKSAVDALNYLYSSPSIAVLTVIK